MTTEGLNAILAGISFKDSVFGDWAFQYRIKVYLGDRKTPEGWYVSAFAPCAGLECRTSIVTVAAGDTEEQVLEKCRRLAQDVVLGALCDGLTYKNTRPFRSLRGPLGAGL